MTRFFCFLSTRRRYESCPKVKLEIILYIFQNFDQNRSKHCIGIMAANGTRVPGYSKKSAMVPACRVPHKKSSHPPAAASKNHSKHFN